ncbi:MAG: hypothetical protein ACLUCA_10705 [Mediterraneibacter gnavus]
MNVENIIVIVFSTLFVIYAVIEILNIVSNVKVKNTYIEYRDLLKEQNDLLNEDIHCLKTLLGIVVDKVESERKGNKK